MAKKITQTIQKEIIDVSTGEIVKVDTQKTFTEKINSEHFYMIFLDYVAPLYKLNSIVARNVLDWMCEHAEYNTGEVDLPTQKRQKLCTDLSITNNQLTNNLKKLKDLNLITGDKGSFTINPEIFWKGEIKARKELLENKELKVSFEIVDPEEQQEVK